VQFTHVSACACHGERNSRTVPTFGCTHALIPERVTQKHFVARNTTQLDEIYTAPFLPPARSLLVRCRVCRASGLAASSTRSRRARHGWRFASTGLRDRCGTLYRAHGSVCWTSWRAGARGWMSSCTRTMLLLPLPLLPPWM